MSKCIPIEAIGVTLISPVAHLTLFTPPECLLHGNLLVLDKDIPLLLEQSRHIVSAGDLPSS